jgi:alpha-beta hydrolase superfamily lysophospholipase
MEGKALGDKDMLDQLIKQSKECPDQEFAIGGHSQGGFVTVSVIPQIPADVLAKVVAVAMFGSRPCPEQVKGRCNSYCNKGDFVSSNLFLQCFGR